jgi:hypothetical protein
MTDSTQTRLNSTRRTRIGVAVTFAALGDVERQAVEEALRCAVSSAGNWELVFANYGLTPIAGAMPGVDLLVYLGESSRFESVAGALAQRVPVVFIKSTVESLLDRPAGSAMRYRMSTGVLGIAQALAQAAPLAPTGRPNWPVWCTWTRASKATWISAWAPSARQPPGAVSRGRAGSR